MLKNIKKYLKRIFGGKDMEGRYKVEDIANYYLSKDAMTPKKLQKILYFAYSWYLAIMNENSQDLRVKLFDNHFEAWIHGPVCPEIYTKYKHKGATKIDKFTNLSKLPKFDEEDLEILDDVWNVYGKYSANQLESITHQHDPWRKARKDNNCSSFDWCNAEIDDKTIFEYYAKELVE